MLDAAPDMTQGGPADPSPDTRQRVLEAAGQVFAELGFRAATVRDICAKAGANVAAVNYHFRDKEGLYREAVRYAGETLLFQHGVGDIRAALEAELPAEQKLRAFVRAQVSRVLDEAAPAWQSRLVMREMVDPTPCLASLCERFFGPVHAALRGVVRELLGPAATEDRVRMTASSIVGQTVFHKHCREVVRLVMPEQRYGPKELEALAEHIAEFSLGAIAALRAQSEAGGAERKGS